MDPLEYETMYRVEDRHWWYLGMETIIHSLLERWVGAYAPLKILDAGCGTGAAMTTYLAQYGQVTGVDLYQQALDFCRLRHATRIARASILDLPFAAASFELVTSFDVLYERAVPNDLTALREFARVLTVGGWVLLRLPAYDWLRGRHDQRVHTQRRYTTGRVRELMRQAGFSVAHLSYANTFLFPLAVIKRLTERILPARENNSDLNVKVGMFDPVLRTILSKEAPLVAGRGLPFGLSVIAVGRKEA